MLSKKVSLLLSLTCCALAGAVMAVLRIRSAPVWLILCALVVLIILLGIAAIWLYGNSARSLQHAEKPPRCTEYSLCISALCFFAIACLRIPPLLQDAMIFSLLLVVAPLLAAAACGLRFLRGEGHSSSAPLALIPIFSLCVHLMCFYRANSNHPDESTFGYEIVVLCLLLIGTYMTAGSKYKRRHPISQRIYAMIPLSALCMELITLIVAPQIPHQASDMNTATILIMLGAGALLISPLIAPVRPVISLEKLLAEKKRTDSSPDDDESEDNDSGIDIKL